ncbi:MAG: pimeloyl-ACP methyl ester carboxylesterase [Saprospiraceae bacterium]|jgi:pimeloyl-ACP methyl ester carboxylesterase
MLKKTSRIFVLLVIVLTLIFFLLRSPSIPVSELKSLYADEESEYMEIEGIDVHYKIEGSGPPLVLIHGTGASLHTWDGWVSQLKESYTLYRLDLPAFGLTGPAADRDYSLENYVEFIQAFTTSVGLDSFALAGNSLGGNIAWSYTLTNPDRVSQLVLIDASGYPLEEPTKALAIQIAKHPILSPLLLHITPRSFVRKNLEQVYGDPSKIKEAVIDRYHKMTLRTGNRHAFVDRANTTFTDASHLIPTISCPTLILWGSEDTWVPPKLGHRFDTEIRNSTLILYPGVGHIPMEEIPNKTATDVAKWLAAQ